MTVLAGDRERAAIIAPGETLASVSDQISDIALRQATPRWWWIGFAVSLFGTALLVLASVNLFVSGIGIWGVNIPVAWGFAIANYVWWIGIASGGTIISALFFVIRTEWRTATNRIAES